MERGEDPEQIESEMGDLLEDEDPFSLPGKRGNAAKTTQKPLHRDDTLYDL